MNSVDSKENQEAVKEPRYAYRLFCFSQIEAVFTPPGLTSPDVYCAADTETEALRASLAEGYRWVRTDGEIAVFEKLI
jgi:hypothetical protein